MHSCTALTPARGSGLNAEAALVFAGWDPTCIARGEPMVVQPVRFQRTPADTLTYQGMPLATQGMPSAYQGMPFTSSQDALKLAGPAWGSAGPPAEPNVATPPVLMSLYGSRTVPYQVGCARQAEKETAPPSIDAEYSCI
jgi:hypothetical protein